MSLRILLLNPPFKPRRGFNREGRCTQAADFWSTPWPPYSLASIAGVLRTDHDVRILDCPAQNIDRRALGEFVAAYQPDMVVSSTSTQTIDPDLRLLRELKAAHRLETAVLGIHATVFAEEILSARHVDFVIRHEPEETTEELVAAVQGRGDLSSIRGLGYVDKDGGVRLTETRPFIQDLDALPFPAWDLVDMDKYRLPFYGRKFVIVNTLRGCPFGCSFCNTPVYYGSRPRHRSVPSIVAEIKHGLDRYEIGDIFFWGDTFTLVREQIRALCSRIIDEGLAIRWVANSRVDTVDKEILELMKRAGCWMLSYGIESGDEAILSRCGKRITRERVTEAVRLTKEAGIKAAGHFILGLPGETEGSAQRTLDFAASLDLDFANFYSAVPFPGSPLYDEAQAQGWIRPGNWERFSQSEFIMNLPTIAASRLRRLRRKAYLSSYLRPKTLGFAADFLMNRIFHPFRDRPGNQRG